MRLTPKIAVTLLCPSAVCTGGSPARAAGCEDIIARHMVGEALLAAHLVALAEKAGLKPAEINATLKSIAGKSAAQEFWITDSAGHAYLTNTGVDFTFSPDAAKQPQASAFWPLITGAKDMSSRRRASAKSMTACSNMSASPASTSPGSCRSASARTTFRIANRVVSFVNCSAASRASPAGR